MKNSLIFSIAGLGIEFIIDSSKMFYRLKRHYNRYLKKRVEPELVFECFFDKNIVCPRQNIHLNEENGVFTGERRDFKCKWSKNNGTARIYPSVYSFDSFLRVVYATEMPLHQRLLMHAAALADGNGAYLFIGPSRSGKTTITRLSSGKKILSDEIVVLELTTSGNTMISATPFWGELECGKFHEKSFPVKEILFLRKALKHYKYEIKSFDALKKFMRCVCTFCASESHVLKILEIASGILENTGASVLHFKKDAGFWKLL